MKTYGCCLLLGEDYTDRRQIFAQLKQPVDPKNLEQREKDVSERIHSQYEKAQTRQTELVSWMVLLSMTSRSLSAHNRLDSIPPNRSQSHRSKSFMQHTQEEVSSSASSIQSSQTTRMVHTLSKKLYKRSVPRWISSIDSASSKLQSRPTSTFQTRQTLPLPLPISTYS